MLALRTVAIATLLAAACASDGDGAENPQTATDGPVPSFEAAFTCAGLADRWERIQQDLLDDLGTAPVGAIDAPDPAVAAAIRRTGAALVEQARDADAIDCGAELTAGAELLCARIDDLVASGPAGESVIADLRVDCGAG